MKPFEVYYWQPPGWNELHPVVVVSHPDRADRRNPVEVVACSTERARRGALPHEVLLDAADGMDWETLCKCDVVYAVAREELQNLKGRVCEARRRAIARTIIAAHGWAALL